MHTCWPTRATPDQRGFPSTSNQKNSHRELSANETFLLCTRMRDHRPSLITMYRKVGKRKDGRVYVPRARILHGHPSHKASINPSSRPSQAVGRPRVNGPSSSVQSCQRSCQNNSQARKLHTLRTLGGFCQENPWLGKRPEPKPNCALQLEGCREPAEEFYRNRRSEKSERPTGQVLIG